MSSIIMFSTNRLFDTGEILPVMLADRSWRRTEPYTYENKYHIHADVRMKIKDSLVYCWIIVNGKPMTQWLQVSAGRYYSLSPGDGLVFPPGALSFTAVDIPSSAL
jgi:hypothetical protein